MLGVYTLLIAPIELLIKILKHNFYSGIYCVKLELGSRKDDFTDSVIHGMRERISCK